MLTHPTRALVYGGRQYALVLPRSGASSRCVTFKMTPLCDLEPDCLSVSLRGAVGSYFVGCVPRRTESEMPLAHSFTVRACGCVCGDCVKVLPHCLLSLSVSSPWASVFSSQLCSSLTTCLQPSAEASRPWITTAVVIVFARGVWLRRDGVYSWFLVCVWFCLFLCFFFFFFSPFCSACAHLRAGLFIRSVGRCAFCWLCTVQSPRLARINSIRDPPRLCAADWLRAWQAATA